MKRKWQKTKFLTIFSMMFLLTACITMPVIQTTPESTSVPSSTPTIAPPTPTIDWFPATETPTPTKVKPTSTTTPVFQGTLLFEDNFDSPTVWDTANSTVASSSVENNKLTLSVNQPAQIISMRSQPSLSNFQANMDITAKICGQDASYGILFRTSNPNNYYKLVIQCDKTIELQRILNGNVNKIMEPIYNPVIPTNLSETGKISILANGNEIEIYINHLKMISISDRYHTFGSIGFFAQAKGEQPMTATFSNLKVYELK